MKVEFEAASWLAIKLEEAWVFAIHFGIEM